VAALQSKSAVSVHVLVEDQLWTCHVDAL